MSRNRNAALAALAITTPLSSHPLHAQPVWGIGLQEIGSVSASGTAFADDHTVIMPGVGEWRTAAHNLWTPGSAAISFIPTDVPFPLYYQADYHSMFNEVAYQENLGLAIHSWTAAQTSFGVTLKGYGTDTLVIEWWTVARATCSVADEYDAWAETDLHFRIDMLIAGVPGNTPVDINYQYELTSIVDSPHEGELPPGLLDEDPAAVDRTQFLVNGLDQTGGLLGGGGRFDTSNFLLGPADRGYRERDYSSPVVTHPTTAGSGFHVEVNGHVDAKIDYRGIPLVPLPFEPVKDSSSAYWFGRMTITLDAPPRGVLRSGTVEELADDALFDFSIDVGSDSERSDPNADGDEVFDPGDVYPWFGPMLAAPAGADGPFDDGSIFAFDPVPDAGDPTSALPTCGMLSFGTGFDLDGHDVISSSLVDIIDAAAPTSIPRSDFDDPAILGVRHLLVSFDDDTAAHFNAPVCEVPVSSESPFLGATYGSPATRDEVVGIDMSPAGGAIAKIYPVIDENVLHVNMVPAPDLFREDDDDVDALDARIEERATVWLFSPDHEAPMYDPNTGVDLNPGGIYEATASGPALVIDPAIHLGLRDGTDVDAFEMVYGLKTNADVDGGFEALAVLFSVDDDDPTTPEDESGSLDPRMIYISFLGGVSEPVFVEPLDDDVDAITTWHTSLSPTTIPVLCPADLNFDGAVDANDLLMFLSAWFAGQADIDADGITDVNDLLLYLGLWFPACP